MRERKVLVVEKKRPWWSRVTVQGCALHNCRGGALKYGVTLCTTYTTIHGGLDCNGPEEGPAGAGGQGLALGWSWGM